MNFSALYQTHMKLRLPFVSGASAVQRTEALFRAFPCGKGIKLCGGIALIVVLLLCGTPAMAQLRGRGSTAAQAKQNEAMMKQAHKMGMTPQQLEQWQMMQRQQMQAAQQARAANNAGGRNRANTAATKRAERKKAKGKDEAAPQEEETEETDETEETASNGFPEPILVTGEELMTRDGVPLQATWFGSPRGKEATPVLLLSGTERSRNDYRQLAPFLQNQGFAVLAVDLRLAGAQSFMDQAEEAKSPSEEDSEEEPAANEDVATEEEVAVEETAEEEPTEEVTGEEVTGEETVTVEEEVTAEEPVEEGEVAEEEKSTKKTSTKREDIPWAKLRSEELELVVEDIETCRNWLALKNNEGELNLNALCIVASDAICIAAIDWMVHDWSGELSVPRRAFTVSSPQNAGQQSQFSKAIVLLSPVEGLRGYDLCRIASEQETIEEKMPIMLFVGKKNREDMRSASKVRKNFERARKQEEKLENKKERTFFYWECDTDATGSALLGVEEQLPGWIAQFFREKVATQNSPWNRAAEYTKPT